MFARRMSGLQVHLVAVSGTIRRKMGRTSRTRGAMAVALIPPPGSNDLALIQRFAAICVFDVVAVLEFGFWGLVLGVGPVLVSTK